MDFISDFVQGFMALFQAGGETFVGWVTGIIPMVTCLMTTIDSIIELIEKKQVGSFIKKLTRFTIVRYTLVPMLTTLFLENPMCYTFGYSVGKKYKPAYYNSYVSFLHSVTGLFPHVNPGEPFVYMGIVADITKPNLPLGGLTVRCFIVGVIVILIREVLTERIHLRLASKFAKEKENAEE